MLTSLISSAVFAVITVTIIERWLRSQEERQNEARRRAEERRLTIVRLVASNAVARAPIAQRRIMWFLVNGGELRRVPEFEISGQRVRELCAILARLGLSETSEHRVMLHGEQRPESFRSFPGARTGRAVATAGPCRPARRRPQFAAARRTLVRPVAHD